MAENKTKPSAQSAESFIDNIENEKKKQDSMTLLQMMQKITGEKPVVWTNGTIAFGPYHYKSARSGQEGDWYKMGLAPRKGNISISIMCGFEKTKALMEKLGKYKTGMGCLYINKLEDVDQSVLKKLMEESWKVMKDPKTLSGNQ